MIQGFTATSPRPTTTPRSCWCSGQRAEGPVRPSTGSEREPLALPARNSKARRAGPRTLRRTPSNFEKESVARPIASPVARFRCFYRGTEPGDTELRDVMGVWVDRCGWGTGVRRDLVVGRTKSPTTAGSNRPRSSRRTRVGRLALDEAGVGGRRVLRPGWSKKSMSATAIPLRATLGQAERTLRLPAEFRLLS